MSVGLKKRDSGEVMQDFVNDVKNSVRECGLQFPEAAAIGLEVPDGLDWSL
jgi:1,2-phenylacetyl-CoA epoxidase catalytic subunit